MRRQLALGICFLLLDAAAGVAQEVERVALDGAVSISQFAGPGAAGQPDVVVDFTVAGRLGNGWTAFVRPWFRRASTDPHEVSREIYQAAIQHEHHGTVSTRLELGYILSPIGLGMMDMRPDTNPVIMPHLSYLVPMPAVEAGVPASLPVASSYPLGAQLTASTTHWDGRVAIVDAPPNRSYVLNFDNAANPARHPTTIVGGGITPRTGLRVGAAYATGTDASGGEITRGPVVARSMQMAALEAEFAVNYSKLSGELVRTQVDAMTGTSAVSTEWFVEGQQTLSPRWFAAGRVEGANAPPSLFAGPHPTLRANEAAIGYRLTPEWTLRSSVASKKTYYTASTDRQAGVSMVWARRWW